MPRGRKPAAPPPTLEEQIETARLELAALEEKATEIKNQIRLQKTNLATLEQQQHLQELEQLQAILKERNLTVQEAVSLLNDKTEDTLS